MGAWNLNFSFFYFALSEVALEPIYWPCSAAIVNAEGRSFLVCERTPRQLEVELKDLGERQKDMRILERRPRAYLEDVEEMGQNLQGLF